MITQRILTLARITTHIFIFFENSVVKDDLYMYIRPSHKMLRAFSNTF